MTQSTTRRDARPLLFAISALVIVLDRVSKLWVKSHIAMGHTITVIPHVFLISHVLNTGAAFSLFEETKSPETVRAVLIGFSVLAALAVLALLWRLGRRATISTVAMALILGGALGNLYDRIVLHYVIDFLEVFIVHYHWPDFNLADSSIVIGACLLFLEVLRPERKA